MAGHAGRREDEGASTIASPHVSPTPPPARDASGREAAHDAPTVEAERAADASESPSDIQQNPSEGVARHRAAPHEAQRGADDPSRAPELGQNPEVEESALPPHEPGSMDIAVHEETYQRFIRLTIRAVIVIFVVLILLAILNT